MVDEFQDTNEAQGVLIALLVGPDGNVCAVADDDQLIYSWRGAEPRNVLEFGERFPGHGRIVLGRNFRSRSEILNAAVACVSQNERRTAKALIAVRGCRWARAGPRLSIRVPRGALDRTHDRPGAGGRHLAGGDPRPRARRLRDRGGANRAGAGRNPASGAGKPRAVRALRDPRCARLPDAAGQSGRRAGVPAGGAGAAARRGKRDHHPAGRARPGAPPR